MSATDQLVIRWAPIPGTAQEQFFDDDTPDAALLFAGGWGSGKTMTLWGKALKLSAINAPLPIIYCVPQYDHVEHTLLPKLEECDPQTGEPWFLRSDQFTYSPGKHELHWIGGGPIWFKSAEHAEAIAGPNVAAARVDEPALISSRAWRNTVARVRHAGARLRQTCAAGTTDDLSWMDDFFFSADRPDRYRRYEMATTQNTELLAADPGYIERIMENATEAEIQTFIFGKGAWLDGQPAYPTFDERLHWTPAVPAPDRRAPLVLTCDFNVAPMCWVIGQRRIGPQGPEAHVLDGITQPVATTDSACEEFLQKFPTWPTGIQIYGDCNGRNRRAAGPVTLCVPRQNPPVAHRLSAVNRLLKNARGVTRLWVRKWEPARACPTRPLVRSLQRTKVPPGKQDVEKKPGETITHAGEALGYWIARAFPTVGAEHTVALARIEQFL
ncbi:MAG: hypothetical protein DMF89_16455 [Acidobacteria bacterium]|nr:MAG: hypothetical protein DMF89_16455 [Acidobacteriota bacterium]